MRGGREFPCAPLSWLFSFCLGASASPHRALVNRAALRLGHPASIPRAETAELLAGGTRERGSPSAIAIAAPFPGAAVNRSGRCTRTCVPPRVPMLMLFGCYAPLAHA
jgi:hypothetical protein